MSVRLFVYLFACVCVLVCDILLSFVCVCLWLCVPVCVT